MALLHLPPLPTSASGPDVTRLPLSPQGKERLIPILPLSGLLPREENRSTARKLAGEPAPTRLPASELALGLVLDLKYLVGPK